MAFPTQEIQDKTRLAKIANEGFTLVDEAFINTNHNKKPSNFINHQYLHNYQRQQPPPPLTVYHPGPQFSTVKFTPLVDPQNRLAKIGEDGFGYVDAKYGKEKMPEAKIPLDHRNCQQAAYVRCGTPGVTVQERVANSNVEIARFYGGNEIITSEDAAKIYRGFIVNEYGKSKN